MIKIGLYALIMPIVIWSFDSININSIFKKNRVYQARVFYIICIFSISYLVVNSIYDLVGVISY